MTDEHTASADHDSKTPVVTMVAPVVAFGATFVARKVLASAYESITGGQAPSNTDRNVSLGKVVAWAAISGATAAVIEAVAYRAVARYF